MENKNKEFLENLVWSEDFLAKMNNEETYSRLLSLDPHIKAMEGVEQKNPHHVYDVLWHTFHVIDNVKKGNLTEQEYRELRIAALFHDIGKPDCMSETTKNGKPRRHFSGHPKRSAEITKPILDRLGYPKEEMERILFYVKYHDIFMLFREKDDPNLSSKKLAILPKTIQKRIQQSLMENGDTATVHDFLVLSTLMRADALGQAPIVIDEYGKQVDSIEDKLRRAALIEECLKQISL